MKRSNPHLRSQGLRTSAALLALGVGLAGHPLKGQPPEAPDAARSMRQEVEAELETGGLSGALKLARTWLDRHAGDAAVQDEFVRLHLTLARSALAAGQFTLAERALQAVVRLRPDHPSARELLSRIREARQAAPGRADQALRWIEWEWFEPAYQALTQARELRPDLADRWHVPLLNAAIGAGDDHYFCKNFHAAFFYYDAARVLAADNRLICPPELDELWLQCLVFAQALDIEVADFPRSYWNGLMNRAAAVRGASPSVAVFQRALRAFALEDMEQTEQAAEACRALTDGAAPPDSETGPAAARRRAILALRQFYDPRLSIRRRGKWLTPDGAGEQTLVRCGFEIRHRSAFAAGRLAGALEFHLQRLALLLNQEPKALQSAGAVVFLHPDLPTLHQAAGRTGDVRGLTRLRHDGASLLSCEIHLYQQDPLLLGASLPHELTHLALALASGFQPSAAALNEGLALCAEAPCRGAQFDRLYLELNDGIKLDELLAAPDQHPADAGFYARAHRLAAVLLQRGDWPAVLRAARAPLTADELAARMSFPSADALHEALRPAPPRP